MAGVGVGGATTVEMNQHVAGAAPGGVAVNQSHGPGAGGGAVGASTASASATVLGSNRNQVVGPFKDQPRAAPVISNSWSKIIALTLVLFIGLYTLLAIVSLCMFEDQCFRLDAAVLTQGTITLWPYAAFLLLVILPLGFLSVWHESGPGITIFILLSMCGAVGLIVCAIVSWTESTDAAALTHADAEWAVMTNTEKLLYNDSASTLQAAYQDSAISFGITSFVGAVLLIINSFTSCCFWMLTNNPAFCTQ